MDTTQVKFEVIDTNLKKSNKTYGYVNPNVDNIQLKNLVTGAYALSKNSVGNIFRIDTTNITGGGGEVTPDTPVLNGKSVSFASTSDFFSTNSATFKSFLQSALAADSENNNDGGTEALSMFIAINDGDKASNVNITYGDLRALVASDTATFGNIVTLINDKLGELETDERVEGAASFSNGTFTFTENENADSLMLDIMGGTGATGNYILKSLYDNTEDTSAFEVDGDSYTLSLATE